MRRMILASLGLLLMSAPGWAQEASVPKAEVFGGFSLSSVGTSGVTPATRTSFYGWQGSANANLLRNFALVGDFGGQYKSIAGISMSNYQMLFGPQVSARMDKVTPFAHMLFGVNRTSALGFSSDNLGLGVGGGLDINVTPKLALRVPQFDWTPVRAGGIWNNNIVRVGFGLVVKLGEK
jgi:opacity protein-like surface antigen